MTIASMTGFARADGGAGEIQWYWEIRSVNARGLDVRTRLPSGFERLEPSLRARLQERVTRGAVSIGLGVRRDSAVSGVKVNYAALEVILSACEELRGRAGVRGPAADGLLALRGVLESDEGDPGGDTEHDAAILDTLDQALAALIEMRRSEGARLEPAISAQIERIGALVDEAVALPSRTPGEIRQRLEAQLEQLLDGKAGFDADRLHQEAVLLATKADIQEELDRLRAHVEAAQELLASGEPVGRRLDFLTQEFNREANTVCSKSIDVAQTRIGLEMKSVIDQLREQVQNVE